MVRLPKSSDDGFFVRDDVVMEACALRKLSVSPACVATDLARVVFQAASGEHNKHHVETQFVLHMCFGTDDMRMPASMQSCEFDLFHPDRRVQQGSRPVFHVVIRIVKMQTTYLPVI